MDNKLSPEVEKSLERFRAERRKKLLEIEVGLINMMATATSLEQQLKDSKKRTREYQEMTGDQQKPQKSWNPWRMADTFLDSLTPNQYFLLQILAMQTIWSCVVFGLISIFYQLFLNC